MLTSPGLRPAVTSLSLGGSAIQIPVRSGLPSARRGAGTDRFGWPSLPRGMLLSLSFHCADNGNSGAISNVAINRDDVIVDLVPGGLYIASSVAGRRPKWETDPMNILRSTPFALACGAIAVLLPSTA